MNNTRFLFGKYPKWYSELESYTAFRSRFSKVYSALNQIGEAVILIYSFIWHIDFTLRRTMLLLVLSGISLVVLLYLYHKVLDIVFGICYQRFIHDNLPKLNYQSFSRGNHLSGTNEFTYRNSYLSEIEVDIEFYEEIIAKDLRERRVIKMSDMVRIVCWSSSFLKINQLNYKTQFVYFVVGNKGFRTIDWVVTKIEGKG